MAYYQTKKKQQKVFQTATPGTKKKKHHQNPITTKKVSHTNKLSPRYGGEKAKYVVMLCST